VTEGFATKPVHGQNTAQAERRGRVVNTLLRIREAPGSKLGYPDWDFRAILQSLQANAGIVPEN
jgi:hypothetical protein